MTQRELQILPSRECYELLSGARVGRLVFCGADGPTAIPVNFAVAAGNILVRIKAGSKAGVTGAAAIAFEVDEIDEESGSGWSVLLRGSAQELLPDEVPEIMHAAGGVFPRPWAEGIHNGWLQITPVSVSGRRLCAEAPSYPI